MTLVYFMRRPRVTAVPGGRTEIAIGEREKMEYLKAGFYVITCREF